MLARREAWLPVLPASVDDYGQEGAARLALEAARAAIVQDHLAALVEAFPPALLAEACAFASLRAVIHSKVIFTSSAENEKQSLLPQQCSPVGAL